MLLGSTVTNVALPHIGDDFGADLAVLQWTVNAYMLPLAGLILLGGSLGDRRQPDHPVRLRGHGRVLFPDRPATPDRRRVLGAGSRRGDAAQHLADAAVLLRLRDARPASGAADPAHHRPAGVRGGHADDAAGRAGRVLPDRRPPRPAGDGSRPGRASSTSTSTWSPASSPPTSPRRGSKSSTRSSPSKGWPRRSGPGAEGEQPTCLTCLNVL